MTNRYPIAAQSIPNRRKSSRTRLVGANNTYSVSGSVCGRMHFREFAHIQVAASQPPDEGHLHHAQTSSRRKGGVEFYIKPWSRNQITGAAKTGRNALDIGPIGTFRLQSQTFLPF